MTRSRAEFYQQASLSQQLADKHPEYKDYAGSDPETSLSLALFRILDKHKIIDLKQEGWRFIWDLLNEQRKAKFATSEKVNEISKMGFQMPKGISEVDFDDDTG